MKKAKRLQALAVLFLCFLCGTVISCHEASLPAGVVARVNGENIYLHSLQLLLDSRSASIEAEYEPSLETLQKNYMNSLTLIIAQTLVRQELAKKGINPEGTEYVQFMKNLEEDYGSESLDSIMDSAFMQREHWENLVKNLYAMEMFKSRILQPGIRVGLDEIKHYYNEHKTGFQLPELYRFCFAASPDRENLQKWCESDSQATDVHIQCLDIESKEIPDDFGDSRNLEQRKCGTLKEQNELWLGIKLLHKTPARKVSAAEAYAIIEKILLAEKQNEEFEKWFEAKIGNSDIQVAPAFNEIFAKFSAQKANAD